MPYFSFMCVVNVTRLFAHTMTFNLALCSHWMSSVLPSPLSVESTLMPSLSSSGVYCHISPVTLYSPMRLRSKGVVHSGSLRPIRLSSTTSPPSLEPKFLLPTNPGACTGTTGIACSVSFSRHTASIS